MSRRFPWVLAAVSVVLLAACGDADEPGPATPDGWQRVEHGALSLAVPAEWVEVAGGAEPWSVGWSDDPDLERSSVVLSAAPELGDEGAENGVTTFMVGARVGGWGYSSQGLSVPVESDELEVHRNDFTYDGVTGVFWAAADPQTGRTVGVQVTGVELAEELVSGIESSIAVRSGASG